MSLSDRLLVMYEGEIVGELDPAQITMDELGLYMAGSKKNAPTKINAEKDQREGSKEI